MKKLFMMFVWLLPCSLLQAGGPDEEKTEAAAAAAPAAASVSARLANLPHPGISLGLLVPETPDPAARRGVLEEWVHRPLAEMIDYISIHRCAASFPEQWPVTLDFLKAVPFTRLSVETSLTSEQSRDIFRVLQEKEKIYHLCFSGSLTPEGIQTLASFLTSEAAGSLYCLHMTGGGLSAESLGFLEEGLSHNANWTFLEINRGDLDPSVLAPLAERLQRPEGTRRFKFV